VTAAISALPISAALFERLLDAVAIFRPPRFCPVIGPTASAMAMAGT